MKYIAFLRGINVGGKSLIKMADLRESLSQAGFKNVSTYIQSGNVIFESDEQNAQILADEISAVVKNDYQLNVPVAVFGDTEWKEIVAKAPGWWGQDKTWKHNLLILTAPIEIQEAIRAIGELKPGIEKVAKGGRVIYQSMSFVKFGQTTTGKLASNPIYQKMTIRDYNTTTKLANLLDSD